MLTLWIFLIFAFVFSQLIQTFAPARPVFACVSARPTRGWRVCT